MSKKSKEEPKEFIDNEIEKVKEEPVIKKDGIISIGGFLSNSKRVKQFNKLNEVAFRVKYEALFKKDPRSYPYNQSEDKWETHYQNLIGVDFSKLEI